MKLFTLHDSASIEKSYMTAILVYGLDVRPNRSRYMHSAL